MKQIQIFFASLIAIPTLVLSIFVAIIPSAIMRLFGAPKMSENWMRINAIGVSRTIMFSVGARVETRGKENLPPPGSKTCFVANHQSMLDIPAIIGHAGVWAGFIAKKELDSVPFLSSWIRAMHCVYIDRKSPRSSIDAIFKGVDHIRNGIPMVIFPEGTRSRTGKLGEFKHGSLKLATRAKALVVPITIDGTRNGLEGKKGIGFPKVIITIAEPIDTGKLDEQGLKDLSDTIFHVIEKGQTLLLPS